MLILSWFRLTRLNIGEFNFLQPFFLGEISIHPVHSHLTNFDATGYHHLGSGSNDTSACEISQAHPADLLNIPKFIYI